MSSAFDIRRLNPQRSDVSPIAVKHLTPGSRSDFDLYIDVGQQLTLYARAPYDWSQDEIDRLLRGSHEHLFYFTAEQAKVESYRAVHSIPEPIDALAPLERLNKLSEQAAELNRIVFSQEFGEAALRRLEQIGKGIVDCVAEDPQCVMALAKLARHDDYTYFHSSRVAAYSVALAMHLSQRDPDQLQTMALGALLHDVGKSKVNLQILNKRGPLGAKEWEEMKQHPVFGEEVTRGTIVAHVPREIIIHHHERFDGSGYPHALTEKELLEEVKIAAFADVFDALTTNRPYQLSRTPFEALDLIRHKLLGNIHKDSYYAMVEILGGKIRGRE